jgi:hypothetical protein
MPLLIFLLGLSGAGVAQLVEHLICNQRVGGSIPSASSTRKFSGGSEAERILAVKMNGLVSLDTSPFCVSGLGVLQMSCFLWVGSGLVVSVPKGFYGTGG